MDSSPFRLGVLDYGAGNLRSVLNALATIAPSADSSLSQTCQLVTQPADFDHIDCLVFPGQGAFGDSVRILKQNQLWQPLQEWLAAQRPYLGICLGYQLLFEASEESPGVVGLSVASGIVRRFDARSGLKIPHMGWNQVHWSEQHPGWWQGLPQPSHLYFVHSYYPEPTAREEILCTCDYGQTFAAGIARNNLVAMQFHPEKSQTLGLRLLAQCIQQLRQ